MSIDKLCMEAEVASALHSSQIRKFKASAAICRVYGVCLVNDTIVWIVMDLYVDGNLRAYLSALQGPPTPACQIWLCFAATFAINSLHSLDPPVLHRDIKSDNFLMWGFMLELADFGSAKTNNGGTSLGTLRWTPPEILSNKSEWTTASDIYSLGMVFYEIVSGRIPFDDIGDESQVMQLIVAGRRPDIPDNCHSVCFLIVTF